VSRIQKIKQALTPDAVLALCQAWLPRGRVQGRCYLLCSPFRSENTPSFAIYLKDGHFYDYGSGECGDLIDLCMRLHGATMVEALEAFEQMLGIENNEGSGRKPEREGRQPARC
jgi:DNA primase